MVLLTIAALIGGIAYGVLGSHTGKKGGILEKHML